LKYEERTQFKGRVHVTHKGLTADMCMAPGRGLVPTWLAMRGLDMASALKDSFISTSVMFMMSIWRGSSEVACAGKCVGVGAPEARMWVWAHQRHAPWVLETPKAKEGTAPEPRHLGTHQAPRHPPGTHQAPRLLCIALPTEQMHTYQVSHVQLLEQLCVRTQREAPWPARSGSQVNLETVNLSNLFKT